MGVATTMPLPGTGTGSRNFLRPPPAGAGRLTASRAARPRCAAGMTSTAPAPMPYRRNCLRVVSAIYAHLLCGPAPPERTGAVSSCGKTGLAPGGGALLHFFCVFATALVPFDALLPGPIRGQRPGAGRLRSFMPKRFTAPGAAGARAASADEAVRPGGETFAVAGPVSGR